MFWNSPNFPSVAGGERHRRRRATEKESCSYVVLSSSPAPFALLEKWNNVRVTECNVHYLATYSVGRERLRRSAGLKPNAVDRLLHVIHVASVPYYCT